MSVGMTLGIVVCVLTRTSCRVWAESVLVTTLNAEHAEFAENQSPF
jgi:hypothetical protein